ncbi:MAG TPA: hypothetical protein VNQ79_24155 [Blastocatellia bacterium]|nr:hypothetical protein [Blastocatellia bacterium]
MANPVVQALRDGSVPKPAKLAAARAMLPMAPEDALEAIVLLSQDGDAEIREAALKSLNEFDKNQMRAVAANRETAPDVLVKLCAWRSGTREIYEALILNLKTPGEGVAELAKWQRDSSLLELITVNQQRLIEHPAIIEAIFANASRSPEAERRAREVKVEFFEKELGAKRIAEERRARAAAASAALGLKEAADIVADLIDEDLPIEELHLDEKLLREEFHIELPPEVFAPQPASDLVIDEIWLEADQAVSAEAQRIADDAIADGEEVSAERLTTMQFIARLNVKQRVQLALKGNREARSILMRDANKMVVVGVLNNPRITEAEVETIASMKSVPEEALRVIGLNRAWVRSYPIIHHLVRNPRTPVATSLPLLNRLFPKDLKGLTGNRNVPEVIRKTAQRLLQARGVSSS